MVKLSEKAEQIIRAVRTSGQNRKKVRELLEKYTLSEDTAGRARLYYLADMVAPEGDISRLVLIRPEEAAEGKEGLFFQNCYVLPGEGQKERGACGRDILEVYVLSYSREESKKVIEGPECIQQLAEDLSRFDGGRSLEIVKRKKNERKEKEKLEKIALEEITEEEFGEMEKLLDEENLPFKEALKGSRNYQEAAREIERVKKSIKEAFLLYTEFGRRSFAYFDLDDTAPEKAKEAGGNIRKWLRAGMIEKKLPPNIDYLARRYFDDRIEVPNSEIKALYLYAIACLPLSRKALVNEDELDLRFFELVTAFKHYQNRKEFLGAEKKRIEEMKEEIKEKRGAFSEKQKQYFKDEEWLAEQIEKSPAGFLELVYEKAGRVQIPPEIRELFRKEHITILDALKYQKADTRLREKRRKINEGFYSSLKGDLTGFLGELGLKGEPLELWTGFRGKGKEFYEQFLRGEYSALKEFLKVGFLGGPGLEENLLNSFSVARFRENWEKTVLLMRKYHYSKGMGKTILKTILKDKNHQLKEFFKDYAGWEIDDFLEKIENTEFGESPPAENFRKKYLEKIKKLDSAGLFDISLIKEMEKVQPSLWALRKVEELKEKVEKAKELLEDPLLVFRKLDLKKKYLSQKVAGLIEKLASGEMREAVTRLKELLGSYRLSLGEMPGEERYRFSLYTADFRLEELLQPLITKEGFMKPEEALECFGFYKNSFRVYSRQQDQQDGGFYNQFEQVVKAEHLHDFISRDLGKGAKSYLKESWEKFNREVKAGRLVFLSEGFQKGLVERVYQQMFGGREGEASYVEEYQEIESLCPARERELLSRAKKGEGRLRVYICNLDFQEDRVMASLTGLSDYDFGKRAWFGCALDLKGEDSVLPLFELRNKVNAYRKKTKKKIWLEVKEEKRREYPAPEEVIETASRGVYFSLKEGEKVKAVIKRAAEGLAERGRYFLGRDFTNYFKQYHGAELVEQEGKKIVKVEKTKEELDKFLESIWKHNQESYYQFEVELVKGNITPTK